MKILMTFVSVMCLLWAGCSGGDNNSGQSKVPSENVPVMIPVSDLATWRFLGLGEVSVDAAEQALYMTETDGSKGITLVSPESYGADFTLRFMVKPATFESVNVVMISASAKDTGGDFEIPGDYDGSFGFWTDGSVQDYVVAFHNAAHNRMPFITRNPGSTLLVEGTSQSVDENWHQIEIERRGSSLKLSVDGVLSVEAADTNSPVLPGGKIAFRLRGTPDKTAAAWFKDVTIETR